MKTINTSTLVSIVVCLICITILYAIVFNFFQNPSFETLHTANLTMAAFHLLLSIFMFMSHCNSTDKWTVFYEQDEIEEGGIAGTYLDFKNVKYPAVEILADSFVKKARLLLK